MKFVSIFILIGLNLSSNSYADIMKCEHTDSNYAIDFTLQSKQNILEINSPVEVNLKAYSLYDNPGELKNNKAIMNTMNNNLQIVVYGVGENPNVTTVFAAVIDLASYVDGYYSGAALLKSDEESEIPSEKDLINYLYKNINNGSGTVVCQII